MGRTTIPDIARKAGVSSATVDRALNGRPGVSPANRQRVLSAAKQLGYLPSEGMLVLPSRPVQLEFLIPFGHNAFMRDVTSSVTEFAATLPLVAACRITHLDGIGPDALIPALEGLSLRTQGVGVITTDHPTSRLAIRHLCEAGVRVVTIASDLPFDSARGLCRGRQPRRRADSSPTDGHDERRRRGIGRALSRLARLPWT